MRFHKFKRSASRENVWIDLDAITVIRQEGDISTFLLIGAWGEYVDMPLDHVLALISPAAAPDPYETRLREAGPGRIIETQADRHKAAHAARSPVVAAAEEISESIDNGVLIEAWAKMTPGEVENVARRDELAKLMQMFRDPFGFNPVTRYVEDRTRELDAQLAADQLPAGFGEV